MMTDDVAQSSISHCWTDAQASSPEESGEAEKEPLEETDAGGDPGQAKRSKKQKNSDSKPRGKHNLFTQFPRVSSCEVCNMTMTTRARCGKPARRFDTTSSERIRRCHHG